MRCGSFSADGRTPVSNNRFPNIHTLKVRELPKLPHHVWSLDMQTHNKVSIFCVLCILDNTCLLCHTFSLLQDIHLILKKPHNLHQTSLLILKYWHNFFFVWENDICLSIFIHLSCNLCLVKMKDFTLQC